MLLYTSCECLHVHIPTYLDCCNLTGWVQHYLFFYLKKKHVLEIFHKTPLSIHTISVCIYSLNNNINLIRASFNIVVYVYSLNYNRQMPYILVRGNLASYSHRYPWRVLVSGLKGFLIYFPCFLIIIINQQHVQLIPTIVWFIII